MLPTLSPNPPHARPIYEEVKTQIQTVLRKHYKYVGTPIEGPGKSDFGDIDILVHGPIAVGEVGEKGRGGAGEGEEGKGVMGRWI